MPRPHRPRHVGWKPQASLFKPAGVPARELEKQMLTIDEVEGLRLVDAEGLDQQEAAERMSVSRATVGRLLESARRKTALALTHGQALVIEAGPAAVHFYELSCGTGQQQRHRSGCGCGRGRWGKRGDGV